MTSLSALSPQELQALRDNLSPAEKAALLFDWKRWARPEQLPPVGEWSGWLVLAGRGWGKTRCGAEAVREEVTSGRSRRLGLVSETAADGRDVIVGGDSGILACSPPWDRPEFIKSDGRPKLFWKNGAIATLYDAREPDQLRGPQHDFIWFDELAKYRYAEAVFDQAMFGLRLGTWPRWMATTTPRAISLLKRLIVQPGVKVTTGKSSDNLGNLAPTYRQNVIDRYKNTRLGRQELDAEILEDIPGALWSRRLLDESRVLRAPQLMRVGVGVDPAVTSGETANENGILVAGINEQKDAFVLEDCSLQGSPDKWARRAVAAYRQYSADFMVAEANQGGEMVSHVIHSVAPDIPVKLVHASRGKYVRAEPISALYEQGRVHHVGTFPELEDQMVSFTPERAADRSDGYSPDRVDSLVWVLTELFPGVISRDRQPPPSIPGWNNPVQGMGVLG